MSFSTLDLSTFLLQAIEKERYLEPTEIQKNVIPLVLEGLDVVAQAQTGSGKSASFILPILEHLIQDQSEGKAKIKVLVLTPTRELSLQVAKSFDSLGFYLPKKQKVVALIGGERIDEQLLSIQKGCDIVVATTGRLLDVLDKKQIDLSHLLFFVLDEADKMLNLGFSQELDLILKVIPPKRQNLLFSATYPEKVKTIVSKITQDTRHLTLNEEMPTLENISQRAILVNRENRSPLLRELLKKETWGSVLVFMANKRASENIAQKFRAHGVKADSFHSDLSQDDRNYTLDAFKAKKFRVLFATDLVSRGLDIDDVSCVINFDLPRSASDYIHRIGRTGRAGKEGVALSFIGHEDREHFKLIEKRSQIKLDLEEIEGFEPTGESSIDSKGKAPVKGKGKSKKDRLREKLLK